MSANAELYQTTIELLRKIQPLITEGEMALLLWHTGLHPEDLKGVEMVPSPPIEPL